MTPVAPANRGELGISPVDPPRSPPVQMRVAIAIGVAVVAFTLAFL